MIKTILSALLACAVVFPASAQLYKSRKPTPQEQQRLSGVSQYVQDVFYRDHIPVYTTTNAVQTITNLYEGTFIVMPTNVAAGVTISLPNPTNNVGRMFTFRNPQATQFHLSNAYGGFTDTITLAVSNVVWLVPSNKITRVWSVGTNYWVDVR